MVVRPGRSRGAHDRELTVVHTHTELTERKCRVSLAIEDGRRPLASSPVRSRSASETKEERWRAVKSVATGDHVTPSRRRVPLGLSHLRDAAERPVGKPLPRSSRVESSAIRYEAGRFDRSTLSIRVVARTGGNLSETTAWLSHSMSPSTHCHVQRRSRAVEDFEISKSSRVRRERSGENNSQSFAGGRDGAFAPLDPMVFKRTFRPGSPRSARHRVRPSKE